MKHQQPRTVKPLTLLELEKLTTARILAYLKKLQACENSLEKSDYEAHLINTDNITFKDSDKWKTQYSLVKAVLAARNNL